MDDATKKIIDQMPKQKLIDAFWKTARQHVDQIRVKDDDLTNAEFYAKGCQNDM